MSQQDPIATEILGVRHSALDAPLPAGSCDCHTHVFGPAWQYGFDDGRTYTPGDAVYEALVAHQRVLGLDRVVIVQPSPYGTDNACTLDAVARLGGAARAVAVVSLALPLDALRALHDQGVRGIRVNLETAGVGEPAKAGAMLRAAADQVAPLGWHVQTYTNMGVIAALHRLMADLPVPLVIDHFGRAMAAGGVGQPGFEALLDLVQSGRAYVKVSAAHRIADAPEDAGPIARALIAANPARIVWGSDWPHPGGIRRSLDDIEPFNPVDDGAALNRLRRWAGDDATLRTILIDNPARLYDF